MSETEREGALDCALSGQSYTERLIDSVCAELNAMAFDLKIAHTVNGSWPDIERDTLEKYDHLKRMAVELRKLKIVPAADAQTGGGSATRQLVNAVASLYSGDGFRGDPTELTITGHIVWLAQQARKEGQTARAQQVGSGAAVGWIVPSVMKNDGWNFTADRKRAENWMVTSSEVQPVYDHPQPAHQGVPENVMARIKNLLCALGHQGAILDDGEPPYDIGEWGIKEAQDLHDILSTPQPEGDGWVKCSERLPTKADANNYGMVRWRRSGVACNGLYNDTPVDADAWKLTGLKRPQPPQEGE